MKTSGRWRRLWNLWPAIVWLAVSVPAFWVQPVYDDWRATPPLLVFDWDYLLPGFFWRPLEKLVRAASGLSPSIYPFLPHALTVLGHGLSGWLVYLLVLRMNGSSRISRIAAAVFLIHPGVSGVVWSIDGVIRAWSTACGLGSVLLYFSPSRSRALAGWLALSALSALWYETGVRWFLATPWLYAVAVVLGRAGENVPNDSPWRRLPSGIAAGTCGFFGYFLVRWILGRGLVISGMGRYDLVFDPMEWARHGLMLVGVSLSTIDTISLFRPDPNYGIAAATFLVGLPLLVVVSRGLLRTWPSIAFVFGTMFVGSIVAPHLPQAHVSEFYAHSIAAPLIVLLAARPAWSKVRASNTIFAGAVVLFLLASLSVNAHKITAMIRSGFGADHVGRKIVEQVRNAPERLCVIADPTVQRHGYSVFLAAPGPASGWGLAAKRHWGWDKPVSVSWAPDVSECPASSDVVLSVSMAGDVRVLRKNPLLW